MHPIIKILLIILLAVLFISAAWYFNLRIFLADYYYRQVLLTEAWPEILNLYQKIFFLQPFEPFYHQRFASDLKWGLKFYQSQEIKIKILDLAIDQMSDIPERYRSFGTKIYLAQLHASKAGLTQAEQDFLIAEQSIERAAEMSPQMAKVYNDWCQLKVYQADWLAAQEMCKKAFYLYPDLDHPQMVQSHRVLVMAELSQVYGKLGQTYIALENYQKAESIYLQILKFFPLRRADIWKKLGDVYYLQGDLNTAIERNFHGYILRPRDSFWSLTLGLLYQEKGDIEQASFWGEKAAQLDPESEKIKNFLKSLE